MRGRHDAHSGLPHGIGAERDDAWQAVLGAALVEAGYPGLDGVECRVPKYPNTLRYPTDARHPLPPRTPYHLSAAERDELRWRVERATADVERGLGARSAGRMTPLAEETVPAVMRIIPQARRYVGSLRAQTASAQWRRADRQGRLRSRRGSQRDSASPRASGRDRRRAACRSAGFQTRFDGVDQRIAEIVETGIDRGAYLQRLQLPRLATESRGLVAPVRERFMPLERNSSKELVDTVRALVPRVTTERVAPGRSRSDLHSALIHQPLTRQTPPGIWLFVSAVGMGVSDSRL